jgi:phytol kinase
LNNIYGIIVSLIFVFAIIGTSTLLSKLKLLTNEGSRKFIHIGVSNWWIIAMLFFDNPFYAAFTPALFIILNYISYRKQLFTAMERGSSKNDLGTVYFAVSLLIISIITFRENGFPYMGALGILIMGYGDGFAAVIGGKFGKHRFRIGNIEKSIEGSIAMFLFSFGVSYIILSVFNSYSAFPTSLLLAAFATLLEAVSPYGTDNLTVPLSTSLLYYILISII